MIKDLQQYIRLKLHKLTRDVIGLIIIFSPIFIGAAFFAPERLEAVLLFGFLPVLLLVIIIYAWNFFQWRKK